MGVEAHALEQAVVVLRLENVSRDRKRPVNVYEARLGPPARGTVAKVVCHAWDSQKPIQLTLVDRKKRRAQFDFHRTHEARHPFSGLELAGTWRAERRVYSQRLIPFPEHPDTLLVTVHFEPA